MTREERAFRIIVAVLTALLSVGFVFLAADYPPENLCQALSTVLPLTYIAVLLITSLRNLRSKELLSRETVLQIVVFALLVYTLPFAIWGITLVVRKKRRMKRQQSDGD